MSKPTSEWRAPALPREFARSEVRLTAPTGAAKQPPNADVIAVTPAPPGDDPEEAVSALAARVAASVAARQTPPPAAGGFGAKQRWTLTRLGFTPRDPLAARLLVVRPTFIAAADLAAWRDGPPSTALPLPPTADAIVDGATPEDQTAFYAVLEASEAGWHSLPLMPLSPPYEAAQSPFVVGPARARLEAFAATASNASIASPELAALIAAALQGLP